MNSSQTIHTWIRNLIMFYFSKLRTMELFRHNNLNWLGLYLPAVEIWHKLLTLCYWNISQTLWFQTHCKLNFLYRLVISNHRELQLIFRDHYLLGFCKLIFSTDQTVDPFVDVHRETICYPHEKKYTGKKRASVWLVTSLDYLLPRIIFIYMSVDDILICMWGSKFPNFSEHLFSTLW